MQVNLYLQVIETATVASKRVALCAGAGDGARIPQGTALRAARPGPRQVPCPCAPSTEVCGIAAVIKHASSISPDSLPPCATLQGTNPINQSIILRAINRQLTNSCAQVLSDAVTRSYANSNTANRWLQVRLAPPSSPSAHSPPSPLSSAPLPSEDAFGVVNELVNELPQRLGLSTNLPFPLGLSTNLPFPSPDSSA